MGIIPEGQAPAGEVYEEPMLVEAGEFTEMTQGRGGAFVGVVFVAFISA